MIMYELKKDFNWFGKIIPKGTLYIQMESDPDRYECRSEGNIKPAYNLTFHTVKNNEEYFKKVTIDNNVGCRNCHNLDLDLDWDYADDGSKYEYTTCKNCGHVEKFYQ